MKYFYIFSLLFFLSVSIWMNVNQSIGIDIQLIISFFPEIFSFFFLCVFLFLIENRVFRNIIILIIILFFGSIYTLQVINLEMIGDYVNLVTLNNANQIDVILSKTLITKIVIISSGFLILYLSLVKITSINKKKVYVHLGLLFCFFLISNIFNSYIKNNHQFLPITNFIKVAKMYIVTKDTYIKNLTNNDLKVAKKFNITINNKLTFEKDYIYKTQLPFQRKTLEKPNVIIFFVESLSARLLGAYKNDMKNVTPNINKFANNAMVVQGYYNHSTPTAPGLYGQNCSIYPLLTYNDMDKTPNILKDINLKCMASYASIENYDTIYFSHSRGHYTHFDQNFKLWGYNEVVMWRNFTKKFLDTDNLILGEAGPSDHQMMKGLVNFLKRRDSRNNFFLGLSTIESHVGRSTNPIDGIKYMNGESETLNLVHNLDDAFGIFWKYFKNSKYYNNTIVILTGDHALYPSLDFKKVAGKDWIASVYDNLSLIIYDPIHILPKKYNVNATSIDLAPTVLQLLNIKANNANSFLGNSIFDEKLNNTAFGISGYQDFNIYINNDFNKTNKKPINIEDKDIKSTYESLFKILKYSKYLRMKE